MSGFKLPNSIFNRIAALPEFEAVPPSPGRDRRRNYLDTILSLAVTAESWHKCCEYGLTPQDVFPFYDEWDRAGLFAAIPLALGSIKPGWCRWLMALPTFTAPMRGRYNRQIAKPKKPKGLVIDLVLGRTYQVVKPTPALQIEDEKRVLIRSANS